MPSNPSSNTWNSPQGPAPTTTTSVLIGAAGAALPGGWLKRLAFALPCSARHCRGSGAPAHDASPVRGRSARRARLSLIVRGARHEPCAQLARAPPVLVGDGGERGLHDQAQRQWQGHRGRRRFRHAVAVGAARHARPDRHQVRVRRGAVRRLHGASRWAGGALVPHAGERRRGRQDHHHRGPLVRSQPSGAEGLDRARRAAVRLLPVGPDHVGGGAARAHPATLGCRHRCRDVRQHLSLRHLSAHPRRDSPRRAAQVRRLIYRPRENEMEVRMSLDRRAFLKSSACVSGGLIIALHLPGCSKPGRTSGEPKTVAANAWLRIGTDNTITFLCDRSEMGQGVYTALPTLIAEELGVDLGRIRIDFAPAGDAYKNDLLGTQITGGSTSVRDAWLKLRRAGAQARTMLISAAAREWGIRAAVCRVENGFVVSPTGKRATGTAQSARRDGDADAVIKSAARVVKAEYQLPLLAHAPLEPQNCTADVRAEGCDIYVPTQIQQVAQQAAASAAGLKPEQVRVHTTFLGGGFGRRLDVDFVPAAVEASKAVGKPVKLLWTREDDTTHDVYRPPAFDTAIGAFDKSGKLIAWKLRLVGPSVTARLFPAVVAKSIDPFAIEAAANYPYDVPNVSVEYLRQESGIIFGLSSTLWGEINIQRGRVQQTNFDTYRVLRINEIPRIDVLLLDNRAPPGGIGEPSTALVAPAVCNAIHAASGRRLRSLPLARHKLA